MERKRQRKMRSLICQVVIAFVAIPSLVRAAEPRNALVMGTWQYTDPLFPALPGIETDVAKMSATLKKLGFTVTVATNPTLGQAKAAVDGFGATLKAARGTGLFYFSGHGCENDGKNYLIPRGTTISTRNDLDDEALSAQRVLTRMEEAGTTVNLVFLDCCRNSLTKGAGDLAPMKATGAFIGFATAAAKEAGASGDGSAYTAALLEYLPTPGISILDMHAHVTGRVKEMTDGVQIPFQYSGLGGPFVLVPSAGSIAAAGGMTEEEVQRRVAEELKKRMATQPKIQEARPAKPPVASRNSPLVNSLGMEFIPVPGKAGVLMCRTETRVKDFRVFAQETNFSREGGIQVMKVTGSARKGYQLVWESDPGASWERPGFEQTENHPVAGISWNEAHRFLEWLSRKERRNYRLPKDGEWSAAAGLDKYPWGNVWPPPPGVGNYAGAEWRAGMPGQGWPAAYEQGDGYPRTAPVASWGENKNGFCDLGGNVWEWCEETYRASMNGPEVLEAIPALKEERGAGGSMKRVLRGGSWCDTAPVVLSSSCRGTDVPEGRFNFNGFRCVLEVDAAP